MNRRRRILYALRRNILAAIPTILAIVVLNFFLLKLAPGDAVDVMAGESGAATEETMRQMRERFGLNLPVLAQLKTYVSQLAQGSLGFSPRYNMPVRDLIFQRLPGTLLLMISALSIAFSKRLRSRSTLRSAKPCSRSSSSSCTATFPRST